MKKVCLILTCLILTSCLTQKRCYRKYPPETKIEIKEIIRDSIIFKDTVIYKYIPADTVYNTDTIYIKNDIIKVNPVEAESNMAKAKAWIEYNRLHLLLTDKENTFEFRMENAIKEMYYWKERYEKIKEVKTPEKIKYVPKFTKIMSKIGIASILLLAVLFGLKMRNKGILKIFK